jgi:hypothetical protein
MSTSRVHLALAAAVGALTLHIPDLLALLNIPDPVKYAIGSVVLAVAYAMYPKQKPAGKADEAGYVSHRMVYALALWSTVVIACAALAPVAKDVKQDPAAATRAALKSAELACLGCAFPDLPEDARDACAKLDPVCKGLAGVCTETK